MLRFLLPGLAAIALAGPLHAADTVPTVHVLLWFDTEDYILPASDDAARKLADWLTKEGVPATFKVVGEKARTLERRKRDDVIAALKAHEIGYHSNWHSVHPTPAAYLSALGWDEGVAEFDRREKSGFDDVKRIFGQTPSCYGQPGSSWGPQSYGALRKWGVPMYLDYGKHVGLDGRPHFYCGGLTVYDCPDTIRADLAGGAALAKAQDRFVAARKKLLAEGGGVVSVYYHPCEFVHKQFWDGVNFAKGANAPREQWRRPETMTGDESRQAYNTFFAYVRFMKRFEDVRFITARQCVELYRDRAAGRTFTVTELKAVAEQAAKGLSFQTHGGFTLAPSEVLDLLVNAVADRNAEPRPLGPTPFGPSEPPQPMADTVTTDASQFGRTAADVADYLKVHGRVPSTVWLGSAAVTPEAFLAALAKVAPAWLDGKPLPESITLATAKLETEKYVADDDPKKLWGWTIFPEGFRAPEMMALARRQAWTIKPAVRHAK